jgi:rubredoxin
MNDLKFRLHTVLWNPFKKDMTCPYCGNSGNKAYNVRKTPEVKVRHYRCKSCWKTFNSAQFDDDLHISLIATLNNKLEDIRPLLQSM